MFVDMFHTIWYRLGPIKNLKFVDLTLGAVDYAFYYDSDDDLQDVGSFKRSMKLNVNIHFATDRFLFELKIPDGHDSVHPTKIRSHLLNRAGSYDNSE